MKTGYKTQHHVLFQPHRLCCFQEIVQAEFSFSPGKGQCQFLFVFGIGNSYAKEVIGWRQLIFLRRAIEREVLKLHVVVARHEAEKQELHIVRQVELWRTVIVFYFSVRKVCFELFTETKYLPCNVGN